MTKYLNTLGDGLMARLEREFTTDEQGLFLQSFSAYLNHDSSDFVIDLDDVWEWMGFSKKDKAKNLLLKEFADGTGFVSALATSAQGASSSTQHGGQNYKRILLTFEDCCMRSGKPKAQEDLS